MADKKDRACFTIQFSETDPAHRQVIDILNRQGRRSKASYLVSAVLSYESRTGTPIAQPVSSPLDMDQVKAIFWQLLEETRANSLEPGKPQRKPKQSKTKQAQEPEPENLRLDAALDVLGEDGLDAVAGALDIFRQR